MESDGFEQQVKKHKDRVYSYAAWMLRDLEEARDVTQEALVRLWQHRKGVEADSSRSWLLTTVHHMCVDRLRRRRRRPEVEADGQAYLSLDRGPGPERLATSSETGRAISRALSSLGPEERAVVLMREVQGMAYDEMAKLLNIPLGTLKARLHRARERLRKKLVAAGVTP